MLSPTGEYSAIFSINQSSDVIGIAENLNHEICITDGINCYIYNYKTSITTVLNKDDNNFEVTDPIAVVMVDTIFIVANGGDRHFVQLSDPNNGAAWSSLEQFIFESDEAPIQALALIDRVLFIVSALQVERWVVNPRGTPFLIRDNMFLEEYGLQYRHSFVNKFNMMIGIFSSRDGGQRVMLMRSGQHGLSTISTPGIINAIADKGIPLSADLYEINGILYYELTLEDSKRNTYSFIFNFSNNTWTESTSPFTKVIFNGDSYFGALGESIYRLKLNDNNQLKQVWMTPRDAGTHISFGVNEVRLLVNSLGHDDNRVFKIGGTINGTTQIISPKEASPDISRNQYTSWVTVNLTADGSVFAPYFETLSNAIVRKMTMQVSTGDQ